MVNRRQVVKFFTSHGFVNKGGTRHDRYEHPDGRWTVIERHTEINDRLFELMKKLTRLNEIKNILSKELGERIILKM